MPRDYEGRPDVGMAERVEEVLRTVEAYRRLHAARLMSVLGVPFPVIVRVLAEPNKRRPPNTASQDKLSKQDTNSCQVAAKAALDAVFNTVYS
jgi:hypothetical protein